MLAGALARPAPPALSPGHSLRDAARILRHHAAPLLAVAERGHVVGVVAPSDVVDAVARGLEPETTDVAEFMTSPAVTVEEEDEAAEAQRMLASHGLRRAPVLHRGRLVGVVDLADLARAASPSGAPHAPAPRAAAAAGA